MLLTFKVNAEIVINGQIIEISSNHAKTGFNLVVFGCFKFVLWDNNLTKYLQVDQTEFYLDIYEFNLYGKIVDYFV
jgi:hypothetical protein